MPRPLRSWLIVGSLLLMPGAALAEETHAYPECTREPTDADTAAAKGAFQAGQGSFNEADYQRAITYWEDAYRRDCTAHLLLLNLARAYELYGQKHQAVLALETYLQRKPDAGQRDQIEKRIEVLNTQIAREPAQPAEQAKPAALVPSAQQQPVVGEQLTEESAGRRSMIPLIVAGAGGAIAVAGGVVFLIGKSDQSKANDLCPNGVCPTQAIADKGKSANTKVNIGGGMAIGGLAVAAGGLIWYFVSKPSAPATANALPRRPHAQLTPAVSHEFAGLSLSGSF
jgi:tetratricopeptide (TPR) repeat protein